MGTEPQRRVSVLNRLFGASRRPIRDPKRTVDLNEARIKGESPFGFGNRLLLALGRQKKRFGIVRQVIVRIDRKGAGYQIVGL